MEDLILDEINSKMSNQIEMSTADSSAQNVFHQTINFFGRPLPTKATFSFATAQPLVNAAKQNANTPTTPATNPAAPPAAQNGNNKQIPVEVTNAWTPYNASMANSTNRRGTFISWPKQMKQKPQDMVKSGFFYTGRGDVVQCFYCGIALKHWDTIDSVDDEHRKYATQCKYLVMA